MANSIIEDLKNYKVRVFIIGAGFSVPACAPVMSNFLSEARELFTASKLSEFHKKNFEQVFNFQNSLGGAQRRVNLDTENIEQLFGIAEWAKLINVHGNGIGVGTNNYNALKNLVGETLKQKIKLCPNDITYKRHYFALDREEMILHCPQYIIDYQDDIEPEIALSSRSMIDINQFMTSGRAYCSPYEAFLYNLSNDSKTTGIKNFFITLNYDTILEHYLSKLEISFSRMGLEEAEDLSANDFFILKPHGSLDWIEKNGKVIIDNTDIGNFDNSVLIPPTWSKTNLSNDNGIGAIIGRIWNSGISVIHNAYQINVLGFSLPDSDQYIRSLIIFGLAKNIKLSKINVFDKSKTTVEKWERLLKNSFNHNLINIQEKDILEFFRTANHDLSCETFPSITRA